MRRASRARRLLPRRRRPRGLESGSGIARRPRARAPRAHALADALVPRAARRADCVPCSRSAGCLHSVVRRDLRRSRSRSLVAAIPRLGGRRRGRFSVRSRASCVPRTLAEARLREGLPDDVRTLVVDPDAPRASARTSTGMLRQIELHYLSNPDPRARVRAPHGRRGLEDDAATTRRLLDERGARDRGAQRQARQGRRGPVSPPAPRAALERRRGALHGLGAQARQARGAQSPAPRATRTRASRATSATPAGLVGIRFVITLDSDTQLPMGTRAPARRPPRAPAQPRRLRRDDRARRRRLHDRPASRRDVAVELAPDAVRADLRGRRRLRHLHARRLRALSGPLRRPGSTSARASTTSTRSCAASRAACPENALVSHDLFEGIHGRAALATDIVLFEDYPSHYAAYARAHAPVGARRLAAPPLALPEGALGAADSRCRNTLAAIDRWKIFDNLRRSLTSPLRPRAPRARLARGCRARRWSWTLGTLALLARAGVPALIRDRRGGALNLARCALAIAFLAHEAVVVVDAIVRVLVRTDDHAQAPAPVDRGRAHGVRGSRRGRRARSYWREMMVSPLLAWRLAALVALVRAVGARRGGAGPGALAPRARARALGEPSPCSRARSRCGRRAPAAAPARAPDVALLRRVRRAERPVAARRQLPGGAARADGPPHVADQHRPDAPLDARRPTTSATSARASCRSACGARSRASRGSPHYQGHLLNWYETKNLQPLLPRYVSTVDSGNFAGCLVALEQGCREVAQRARRSAPRRGKGSPTRSTCSRRSSASVAGRARRLAALGRRRMRRGARGRARRPRRRLRDVSDLCDETSAELDRELLALLETGALRHDADTAPRAPHVDRSPPSPASADAARARRAAPLARARGRAGRVRARRCPTRLRLDEIPRRRAATASPSVDAVGARAARARGALRGARGVGAARSREALAARRGARHDARRRAPRARRARRRRGARDGLPPPLRRASASSFASATTPRSDQLDAHYYDLLASEARLASYLAIVKGDVPESHWSALGRPMTRCRGAPAAPVVGRHDVRVPDALAPDAEPARARLLAQTCELVVERRSRTAEQTRRAVGHLRVGLRAARRAADVPVPLLRRARPRLQARPRGGPRGRAVRVGAGACRSGRARSLDNLQRARGDGDARDVRPLRGGRHAPRARAGRAPVRGRALVHGAPPGDAPRRARQPPERPDHGRAVSRRPGDRDRRAPAQRARPRRRAPRMADRRARRERRRARRRGRCRARSVSVDRPDVRARPQAFVLEQRSAHEPGDRLRAAAASAGRAWRSPATSPTSSATATACGSTCATRRAAASGSRPRREARTTYAMHKAEFHRRDEGISVHVDVAVAPADDVEVRQITLHNETDRTAAAHRDERRRARAPRRERRRATHPAFASMFVESEWLADLDALLFARRPQSAKDEPRRARAPARRREAPR